MIDLNDYIIGKQYNKKYHCYCDTCGRSRGYHLKHRGSILCRDCSTRSRWAKELIRMKEGAILQNRKILNTQYTGRDCVLRIKCNRCSNTVESRAENFNRGAECHCGKKTENKVRTIFETHFDKQFPTKRPKFLNNPDTGWSLELDGYNEELKLAFEYDGEFHYEVITYFNNNLGLQQQRDKLKDKLCKQVGITLIRIPYWEKDNLEDFISKQLTKIQ